METLRKDGAFEIEENNVTSKGKGGIGMRLAGYLGPKSLAYPDH